MEKTIFSVVCTTMSNGLVNSYVVNSFEDESRAIQCKEDAFDNAISNWEDFEEDDYDTDIINCVLYNDDKVERYSVEQNTLMED